MRCREKLIIYTISVYLAKHSDNLLEDLKNLDKIMKNFPDEHDNYRSFGHSACAQQILRLFQQNLRSYFANIKDYKKILRSTRVDPAFRNLENLVKDSK